MKEIEIRKAFNNRFKTLPSKYFSTDYKNVNFNDNKKFVIPQNNKFFEVQLFVNPPEQIGIVSDGSLERFSGFYQIDVCVPLDVGFDGLDATAKDIFTLFKVGTTFGDVTVTGCYNAMVSAESTYYREVIRINYDADINNE